MMDRTMYLSAQGTSEAKRRAVVAAVVAVLIYVGAVVVDVSSTEATGASAVMWHLLRDALLVVAGLLVGVGGFVWVVRRARRERLVHQTGALLLALTSNIKTLTQTLAATVWELSEPLHSDERLDKITPDDAGRLLYSKEGEHLLLRLFMGSFAPFVGGTGSRTTRAPSAEAVAQTVENCRAHVGSIAQLAETLHQRALELAEYEPNATSDLLAATGAIRQAADEYRHDTFFGPQAPKALATSALGLFVILMKSLVAIIRSAEVIEEDTAKVLGESAEGEAVLVPYLEGLAEEKADREQTVELTMLFSGIQGTLDDMFEGLDEISGR